MLCRIPLLRSIALLLVVSWLAGGLSSQVHHLMVQHVVCPEHGTLQGIHLDETEHQPPVDQLAQPQPSQLHGDHGCVFLAGFFSSPPPAVIQPPVHVWAPPVPAPTPRVLGPRAPPLRFAPKTSPPLA